MANPFEEEFGTFTGPPASDDNPFVKEFGAFGSKVPSQKSSVGASVVAPKKEERGVLGRIADSAGAGAMSANLEGFGGLVARKGFEISGYGIDKLKEKFPGKDEAWYKSKQKAIINQTMLETRKAESDKIKKADLNIPGTDINPVAFAGGIFGGADPTYAIGGGIAKNIVGGAAKKVAARVGVTAAEQAVLGAATDAAYQGADIIDGLQNKFNVERNLANAAFGAGFGSIQGAAHEVSPFIKQLFETRRKDTKPSADPRPVADSTTPMTGDDPLPSFKERAAETLRTGTEQDIHNLFKGSNIPAPWRADTARYVAKRDADMARGLDVGEPDLSAPGERPVEGTRVWDKTDGQAAATRTLGENVPDERLPQSETPLEPSQMAQDGVEVIGPTPLAQDREARLADYSQRVGELTKGWKNAPEFEIVNHPDEVADPTLRQYIADNDPEGDALGLYGKDGKVRIFADRIDTPETLNAIVFHEALGHHGLSEKFGERLEQDLNTLTDRNVGQFGKKVDEWQKKHPDAYGGDRTKAAEEVLAEMSEKGEIVPSVADALVKTVRDFGRRAGLKIGYSDGEIRTILGMAHASVVSGYGRNVGLNGFRVQANPVDENGTFDARMKSGVFARRSDLQPKDVAEEAYEWLSMGYKPSKPRSWEETQKMAYEVGITPEGLKKRRGVGNLDRDIFIASRAAEMAEADLMGLAVKANSPEGLSTADFERGIEATANFQYALGRLNNDISQVGRALNAVKAVKLTKNNLISLQKALDGTNMEAMADPEFMGNFLKQYANMVNSGNPAGATSMLKGINTPYWWQYILSARQNMLLSGLSTHLKATVDMTSTMGRELMEATLALPPGMVRSALQSMGMKNVKSGMTPAAYGMKLWGLARAGFDAQVYKQSADTLIHGGVSRYGASQDARVPVLSKVSDALAAQDVFFRSFFENSNLYYLGALKAEEELRKAGGKYTQFDVMDLGSSYAQTPSISMRKEAVELAENAMLVNKSRINTAIDQAKLIRPNMGPGEQAWKFVINLLTPFIRTSANGFANQIVRRSPLALLDHQTWADFKAGGAKADVAFMRIALGTTILGSYWVAAGDKDKYKDDGGELSPAKYAELRSGGKSFNAIKTTDEDGTEYNRTSNLNMSFNPLAKDNATFAMVQSLRNAWEKGAKEDDIFRGLKLALYKIGSTFAEQTFVSNLGDPITGLNARGPRQETQLDQFFGNTARTFLPNIGVQAANIIDPNQHDIKGLGLKGILKDNVPGMSGGLPIKHDVYGQPMQTGTSVTGIPTAISKGNRTKETTNPAELELVRLAERTPAAVISPVPKSIAVGDNKIKLTGQQYQDFQRDAGQALVAGIEALMEDGTWDGMDDKERIKESKKIQTEARKEAKANLFPADDDSWMTDKQRRGLENDDDPND